MQTEKSTGYSNSTSWLLNQWNHSFQYVSTVTTDYLKFTINYLKNWNKSEDEELYSILPKNRRVWLTDLQDGLEEATRNIIEGKYTLSDFSLHLERLNSLVGPKRISPIQFRQTLINFQKKLLGFDNAITCRAIVENIQAQLISTLLLNPEFCEDCLIADVNDYGKQWADGQLTTSALLSALSYYNNKADLHAKRLAIDTLRHVGETSNHPDKQSLESKLNQLEESLEAKSTVEKASQRELSSTKENIRTVNFNALTLMSQTFKTAYQWISEHPYLSIFGGLTVFFASLNSSHLFGRLSSLSEINWQSNMLQGPLMSSYGSIISASLLSYTSNRLIPFDQKGKSAVFFAGLFSQVAPTYSCLTSMKAIECPINLYSSHLNGKNGFMVVGDSQYLFGWSLDQLGDINNDGLNDFIVDDFESAYAILGRKNFLQKIYASYDAAISFSGKRNSFRTVGSRIVVNHAGDFDGNGYRDIILGVPESEVKVHTQGNLTDYQNLGKVYVYLHNNYTYPYSLDEYSRMGGQVIYDGEATFNDRGYFGYVVSGGGDFNGDGFDDVATCHPDYKNYEKNEYWNANKCYLIYGRKQSFNPPLIVKESTPKNQQQYTVIRGMKSHMTSKTIQFIGDINRDGFDDLVIDSILSHPNNMSYAGKLFFLFGHRNSSRSQLIDLNHLSDTELFEIHGNKPNDYLHYVSGSNQCDFNRDGFNDIIIHADKKDYIIYGRKKFPRFFNLSRLNNPEEGFFIHVDPKFYLGSTSCIGDINEDGWPDLGVRINYYQPHDGTVKPSTIFVVFGKNRSQTNIVHLDKLGYDDAVTFQEGNNDQFGYRIIGLGDINGDHVDDFGFCASSNNDDLNSRCYFLFGHKNFRYNHAKTLGKTEKSADLDLPESSFVLLYVLVVAAVSCVFATPLIGLICLKCLSKKKANSNTNNQVNMSSFFKKEQDQKNKGDILEKGGAGFSEEDISDRKESQSDNYSENNDNEKKLQY